jgi:hypothetical protein
MRKAQESRREAAENRKREKLELKILLKQVGLERGKLQTISPQPPNLVNQQAA